MEMSKKYNTGEVLEAAASDVSDPSPGKEDGEDLSEFFTDQVKPVEITDEERAR